MADTDTGEYTYGDLKIGDEAYYLIYTCIHCYPHTIDIKGTITNITKDGHVTISDKFGRSKTIFKPSPKEILFKRTINEDYKNPFEVGMKVMIHSHVTFEKFFSKMPVRNKDGSILQLLNFRSPYRGSIWEVTKVLSNNTICIYDTKHDEAFFVPPWFMVNHTPYTGDLKVGDRIISDKHKNNNRLPPYFVITDFISNFRMSVEGIVGSGGSDKWVENPYECSKVKPYIGCLQNGGCVEVIDGIYTGYTGKIVETYTDDDIRVKFEHDDSTTYRFNASELMIVSTQPKPRRFGCGDWLSSLCN